jgi:hypothetical protein
MNAVVGVIALFLVVAVPIILLAFFRYSPDRWRETLHQYQNVVGSFVALFAAGLALVGVLITVSVQKENTDRQLVTQREQFDRELREQRATEDRTQAMRQRQVASGFVGEINVILARFRSPIWRQNATKALDDLKLGQLTGADKVDLRVSTPTAEYATFFRANSGEIGRFPQPIPQDLLLFYGYYINIEDNLKMLSEASKENFAHTDAAAVELLLKDQLDSLDALEKRGAALITQLQKIAVEPVQ